MIRPNGPLVTGLRQVVMPVGSRGPSAIATWPGVPGGSGLIIGGRSTQSWGLYDTVPAVVTPNAGPAARAIYGLRESLTLLMLCPIGMTRSGGHVFDADGVSGYGFATGGWGRSNTPMRIPRSVVILDESLNLEFDASFVDTFNARYVADLYPLAVEVVLVRAPAVFTSAVPMVQALPVSYQANISTDAGDPTAVFGLYDLFFTTYDPANLQGGQVLFVGIGGGRGGYSQSRVIDSFFNNYLIINQFTYGAVNPPQDPESIIDTVVLGMTDDGVSTTYSMNARDKHAKADAALLNAVSARCQRFAFDVVGLTGNTANASLDEQFTVQDADDALRNGVLGQASEMPGGDSAALANAIADRALSFFS